MFHHFFSKKPVFWGIDLSFSALTVVQLSKDERGLSIDGWVSIPLRDFTELSFSKNTQSIVLDSLERLLKESFSPSAQVILAIPDALAVEQWIDLPAGLSSDYFEELVRLHIAQSFPEAKDSLYFDYESLDRGGQKLRWVGVKKDVLDSRLQVFQQAGFQVSVVDLESDALKRGLAYLFDVIKPETWILFLDCGGYSMRSYLLHDHRIQWSLEEYLIHPRDLKLNSIQRSQQESSRLMALMHRVRASLLALSDQADLNEIWFLGNREQQAQMMPYLSDGRNIMIKNLSFNNLSHLEVNQTFLATDDLPCGWIHAYGLALRGFDGA